MYKLSFLICFAFLFTKSAKSQTTDTINLNASEQQFSDSIAQVNEQNQGLKASRDAYNEGLLLLGTENYIEAITHFTNAITIDSIFSEAYLSRAKCYEGQNDELAIVDYLKAFELDSSKVFPLYSVAALQFKTDKELAKQTYSLIIALNESEFKAISQLGIIAFLAKEYNTAEQYFTQSLAINTNAYTLNDRGSCYRKLDKLDLAVNDYLAAIALNSDLAFVYSNLASVYANQGDPEKALNYYDLAISIDVNYALAYNNKASILLENKEFDKANSAINKALVVYPDYAPAYNNKGVINHQLKKYEEAIDDFDKAISLDDNYAKAYLNRGVSKQMTRDEDGACSDWYKAKELGIMMVKKYLANDCE